MPKVKTKKAVAKRFKLTASGQVKRAKAFKSHILTKKTRKRKRNLRKSALVAGANAQTIRLLLQQ